LREIQYRLKALKEHTEEFCDGSTGTGSGEDPVIKTLIVDSDESILSEGKISQQDFSKIS
jgi:hypothetical protein